MTTSPIVPRGLVVAAPSSGAGKTTVTLGLARALRNRGLKVRAFKCGPDYIDPAFHRAATGHPSFNLDSWAMDRAALTTLAARAAGADIVIAEGAMGLFDGVAVAGETGTGASADIAALMGWPVLLVLDVAAQAQTAAAVALGLARYRPDVRIAGVILNRVGSARHEALVRAGFEATGLPIFGAIPRTPDIAVPARHLGLVQAEEQGDLESLIERAAAHVARSVDLDRVIAAARPATLDWTGSDQRVRPPGQRVALARDVAFSFLYPHVVEGWREAGAEILPFSPLADEAPAPDADVTWLPGGYPELHAGTLAATGRFLAGLRAFAATRPVHGECGGYMVMGEALIDAGGVRYAMAGLLGLVTSFADRGLHLGYRLATLQSAMPGHGAGSRLRGHEFHYARIIAQPDAALAHVVDATGQPVTETGSRRGLATGTFFHLIAEAS